MNPAPENNDQSFINVTVKTIDGDVLVLETASHELMRWPLKNIPQPLELGATLTLELKTGKLSESKNSTAPEKPSHQKEDPAKLQRMYHLLEELVN